MNVIINNTSPGASRCQCQQKEQANTTTKVCITTLQVSLCDQFLIGSATLIGDNVGTYEFSFILDRSTLELHSGEFDAIRNLISEEDVKNVAEIIYEVGRFL